MTGSNRVIDAQQTAELKWVKQRLERQTRFIKMWIPIVTIFTIGVCAIPAVYVANTKNGKCMPSWISDGTNVPICQSLRVWTPFVDASTQNENYKLGKKELEALLLKTAGGWSKWEMEGAWFNDDTQEIETERGVFYEVVFTDCSDIDLIKKTVINIERIIQSKDRFAQKSAYIIAETSEYK